MEPQQPWEEPLVPLPGSTEGQQTFFGSPVRSWHWGWACRKSLAADWQAGQVPEGEIVRAGRVKALGIARLPPSAFAWQVKRGQPGFAEPAGTERSHHPPPGSWKLQQPKGRLPSLSPHPHPHGSFLCGGHLNE